MLEKTRREKGGQRKRNKNKKKIKKVLPSQRIMRDVGLESSPLIEAGLYWLWFSFAPLRDQLRGVLLVSLVIELKDSTDKLTSERE